MSEDKKRIPTMDDLIKALENRNETELADQVRQSMIASKLLNPLLEGHDNFLEDPYYADLFIINKQGCLVMGHGKSKTCRHYTGKETLEICSDCVRLTTKGKQLVGYGDPAMGMYPMDFKKLQPTYIQYLIYMQAENETTGTTIKEISKGDFCNIAAFNITFTSDDYKKRMEKFKKLIEGTEVTCITVPWSNTMEEKGRLIKNYITE